MTSGAAAWIEYVSSKALEGGRVHKRYAEDKAARGRAEAAYIEDTLLGSARMPNRLNTLRV